ncbi:hypothetical protein GCM10027594_11810 [Hymenobacter agri]
MASFCTFCFMAGPMLKWSLSAREMVVIDTLSSRARSAIDTGLVGAAASGAVFFRGAIKRGAGHKAVRGKAVV